MARVSDGIRQLRSWRNTASRLVQSFCNALIFKPEEVDRKTNASTIPDIQLQERKNHEDQLKALNLPEVLGKATRLLLERAGRLHEEGKGPLPSNLTVVAQSDRDLIGNVTRVQVIISGYTTISPQILDETIKATEDQLNGLFSVSYSVDQVEEKIVFSISKGL